MLWGYLVDRDAVPQAWPDLCFFFWLGGHEQEWGVQCTIPFFALARSSAEM